MPAWRRHRWVEALRVWWPPVHRPEFWVVQSLVIGIAIGHALIEGLHVAAFEGADFVPVSLYLLPVIYASLSFGIRGAAPTAVWAFLLTLPNIALWHGGMDALGELWQAGLVLTVGLLVGARVDRERHARQQAEARERERQASEDQYRGLFEAASDAVLLLDEDGRIKEANASAVALLEVSLEDLCGTPLQRVSAPLWESLRPDAAGASAPVALDRADGVAWVQVATVPLRDADGRPHLLAQFHDVTDAHERQHLLETFARGTVAAREEERRRVARELHDGPLQSLILLWRDLDGLGMPTSAAGRRVLAGARHRAEQTADELRRFSRDLRPSVLDDLGLPSALRAEAAALHERTSIEVSFEAAGDSGSRLPTEIELTLLRICQEALRNVERHARARHVGIRLEVEADHYRLTVRDDGVGIGGPSRPSDLVAAGRLGVVGMHERARLVGAACSVEPANPGTLVEVRGRAPEPGPPAEPAQTVTVA